MKHYLQSQKISRETYSSDIVIKLPTQIWKLKLQAKIIKLISHTYLIKVKISSNKRCSKTYLGSNTILIYDLLNNINHYRTLLKFIYKSEFLETWSYIYF